MRILLAGPGTGKTSNTKRLVDQEFAGARILILSFTNATVNDLRRDFEKYPNVDCYTLHSYALRINHLTDYYVLDSSEEEPCLRKLAATLDVDFAFLCRQLKCITFDAMVEECLTFLEANPVYARDQIGDLDLLIVDEYQDFNAVERGLLDRLATYAAETIVLGDDDQSIYGFKDADPDGIIAVYQDETVQKIAHENNCYRCPDLVVECAKHLIQNNKNRIDKPWHATGREGVCDHQQFRTQQDTNEYIAMEIQRIREAVAASASEDPTTILVLSPVRFYVDDLVQLLESREIPFVDFWTQAIDPDDYQRVWWIRAILSHRTLLNLTFLHRTLSQHFRKKFRATLAKALAEGFDEDQILEQVQGMFDQDLMRHVADPPEPAELADAIPEFAHLIDRLDQLDIEKSLDHLLKDANPSKAFSKDAVNVMSIHKSKGLQADVVFIKGLVDGVLPNSDKGIDTIEAQRRLLFVGVTRALQALHLLSTVEWDAAIVHKVDKSQFKFSPFKRNYRGTTSKFVTEMK